MNTEPDTAGHAAYQRATLARMSRQIAEAFAYLPDDDAASRIAEHINQFWSRAMRRDLARMFDPRSSDLHALVRHAWGMIHFPTA